MMTIFSLSAQRRITVLLVSLFTSTLHTVQHNSVILQNISDNECVSMSSSIVKIIKMGKL